MPTMANGRVPIGSHLFVLGAISADKQEGTLRPLPTTLSLYRFYISVTLTDTSQITTIAQLHHPDVQILK